MVFLHLKLESGEDRREERDKPNFVSLSLRGEASVVPYALTIFFEKSP